MCQVLLVTWGWLHSLAVLYCFYRIKWDIKDISLYPSRLYIILFHFILNVLILIVLRLVMLNWIQWNNRTNTKIALSLARAWLWWPVQTGHRFWAQHAQLTDSLLFISQLLVEAVRRLSGRETDKGTSVRMKSKLDCGEDVRVWKYVKTVSGPEAEIEVAGRSDSLHK